MRWKGRVQSKNIEDRRRGPSGRQIAVGGGIGTLAIALIVMLLGGDPTALLQQQSSQTGRQTSEYVPSEHEEELKEFISVALHDTEEVWNKLFQQMGRTYREPKLVLFNNQVQSACGFSSAATGPFYCPGDEKVYIDLNFLQDMQKRLGAKGDFAIAYIIYHEVGHHIQKLVGTMEQMNKIRRQTDKITYNKYMVRLELQADFFAGVCVHHAQKQYNILEKGDLQEAINAAGTVGDDRIQKNNEDMLSPIRLRMALPSKECTG